MHLAALTVPAPAQYPFIHELANAAYACGHFCLFFVYLTFRQLSLGSDDLRKEHTGAGRRKKLQ